MVSADLIRSVAGRAILPLAEPLAGAFGNWWPIYGITTLDRQAIFLAQACHETDGFHTLHEYASGDAYEGRADLGNLKPGDGRLYKGRGVFMLTGRDNYRRFGNRINLDLEKNPEQAAIPHVSVQLACVYWQDRGLSEMADRRDMLTITRRINGGTNGLEDRFRYWARAWRELGR